MVQFGIAAALLAVFTVSSSQDAPVVNILPGAVLGTRQLSRNGTEFFSFRGIRFAEPPVDELRFKPPVPIEQWEGTFNATEDGPACLQPNWSFGPTSEDCLRINVYTRRITEVEDPRPVLVFIHGGAYTGYTGASYVFGPEYIMDHDIVLVTPNYRLGTIGWLSTGDKYAPGNYGMKDQVEALRWVQRNIKYFGGDPNRVTIAGESAGAASVGLHLLSPMSRGLFHGAITASGSGANSWSIDRKPLEKAIRVAEILNCPTNNTQDLMACIRKVPAEDVANVYHEILGWHDTPGVITAPVVEEENDDGTERFLIKDTYQSLQEGDIADVSLFVGTTKDEFKGSAVPVVLNKEWADDLSENWNEIAPLILGYDRNDSISELVRSYYLGSIDKPITNDSFEALGQLFADATIIFGTVQSAQIISEKNSKPVYLYQFNYQGRYSASYWPGTNETIGVLHGDDLIYLFYSQIHSPIINGTDEDGPVVDRFTTLWKNFVETGNPTPEPEEILDDVVWKPFKNDNPAYLDINSNLKLVEKLYYEERMLFWNNLFPLATRKSGRLIDTQQPHKLV